MNCLNDKSYIIIEGLSDFGLELIDWLIVRGARRLVVASSTAINNGYQNLRFNLWKSYGVQIVLRTGVDISNAQNIKNLIKDGTSLGPVDAIFDLGKVCSSDLKSSEEKTIAATKSLDTESRAMCPNLRLFVVCSATTNTGSMKLIKKFNTNDYMNSPMNSKVLEILEKRKKDGLHGLLINYGLIETAKRSDNIVHESINLPPVTKYLQKLDEIIGSEETILEMFYVVPSTFEVRNLIHNCLIFIQLNTIFSIIFRLKKMRQTRVVKLWILYKKKLKLSFLVFMNSMEYTLKVFHTYKYR